MLVSCAFPTAMIKLFIQPKVGKTTYLSYIHQREGQALES